MAQKTQELAELKGQNSKLVEQLGEAERAMRMLDEHLNHIESATFNVVQRGQDLLGLFESSGISLMADSQYNGETRVQVLLEYLQVFQHFKQTFFGTPGSCK